MSTADIPVLTKVINKPKKSDSSETLNMTDLVAQVKLALLPELQNIIQQQLEQTAPDSQMDTSLIEKQLQEAQFAMLIQARKDMQEDGERITKELTVSISQAISEKITGMQELAVNQARSKIGDIMTSIESGFKEATQSYAKQQEIVLAGFFEQQALQTKTQMAEKAKSMSDQLLDAVKTYTLKLSEEGKANLDAEHVTILASLLGKSKQAMNDVFIEIAESQQQLFTQQLTAKLPEFEQVLSEKVTSMVANEMKQQMKAIEDELTSKLKLNIIEVLQGIKFVFPNANHNSSAEGQ